MEGEKEKGSEVADMDHSTVYQIGSCIRES